MGEGASHKAKSDILDAWGCDVRAWEKKLRQTCRDLRAACRKSHGTCRNMRESCGLPDSRFPIRSLNVLFVFLQVGTRFTP